MLVRIPVSKIYYHDGGQSAERDDQYLVNLAQVLYVNTQRAHVVMTNEDVLATNQTGVEILERAALPIFDVVRSA